MTTVVDNSASVLSSMLTIPDDMATAKIDEAYINDKLTKFIETHSIDVRILNESSNNRVLTKPISHENVSYLSSNENLSIGSNDSEDSGVTYATVARIAKPKEQQKSVNVQDEQTTYATIDFTKKAPNLNDEINTLDTAGEEEDIFGNHDILFGPHSPNHIDNIAQDESTHVNNDSLSEINGVDNEWEDEFTHVNNDSLSEIDDVDNEWEDDPIYATSQPMAPRGPLPFPDRPLPETPRSSIGSSIGKFFDSFLNVLTRFFGIKSN